MKILYISALSSERIINYIYQQTNQNPGFAVQKFSRLLVKGFLANGVDTIALSNPGITSSNDKRKWINIGKEVENGVIYKYTPFINLPVVKHICVFLYTFFYVLFGGLKDRSNKAIVCDVLSISACMAALLASKINRVRSVGVVTDIYSQMTGKKKTGLSALISKTAGKLQNWYSTSFTHYVLLTEQMNELVNPHKRPYIVMEALCDSSVSEEEIAITPKEEPTCVMYAGGLEVKYGIKCLVDGFRMIDRDDIRLVLYGHGTYVRELEEICKIDHRVEYRGIAPNQEVVKAELRATLLVNPRFTTEAFAKYSFPSKNMEYMSTATPLLTTNLPGMPEEYHNYVYLFDDETPEGYARVIENILSKNINELSAMGKSARRFVLDCKNNKVQTLRILNLIKK